MSYGYAFVIDADENGLVLIKVIYFHLISSFLIYIIIIYFCIYSKILCKF